MIIVKQTSIQITDYTLGDVPVLEKILSVWDPVTFSVTFNAYIYDEENKTLTIPGGFDVKYLSYLLKDHPVKYEKKTCPTTSAIYKMKVDPKDDNQKESIDFLLSKGNYSNLSNSTQRMLCLKTGGGKTYCTINALSKKKVRGLILVDQDKIMKQWNDEILKFTDLHENDIYFIAGSDTITHIMEQKDVNYKLYIVSHRTISSYAANNGWESIGKLFEKMKIGVKVYDEAHVEYRNIFMIDAYTNVKDTIYLTATPGRSNRDEDKVYQNMFKTIPKYGLEEKFDNNYHNIYYVSYNSKPTLKQQLSCNSKHGFSSNAYSDYIFNNEDKLDIFLKTIKQLLNLTLKSKTTKTALIVHKNDHLLKLKDILEELYPDIEIGIFSSLIKDIKKREKELDKQLILSTDKSLGKAVNIPNLQYLIMTVPTSSTIVTEQILGRLRKLEDKKVFYFDVTDDGFETCKNQRYNRRKILNKKAVSIKNINM